MLLSDYQPQFLANYAAQHPGSTIDDAVIALKQDPTYKSIVSGIASTNQASYMQQNPLQQQFIGSDLNYGGFSQHDLQALTALRQDYDNNGGKPTLGSMQQINDYLAAHPETAPVSQANFNLSDLQRLNNMNYSGPQVDYGSPQNQANLDTTNAAYTAAANKRQAGNFASNFLSSPAVLGVPLGAAALFSAGGLGGFSAAGDGLTGMSAGSGYADGSGLTAGNYLQGASAANTAAGIPGDAAMLGGGGSSAFGYGGPGIGTLAGQGIAGGTDASMGLLGTGFGGAATGAAVGDGTATTMSGLGGFLGLTSGTGIGGSGFTLGGLAGAGSLALGAATAMGGNNSAPTFDPVSAANAQTASNQQTALYQSQLNNIDQVTPYGTLNYTSTPGVNGGPPHTTATSTLSPAQQAILNNQQNLQQQQQGISKTALDQAGVNQASPFNLGGLSHQLASASSIADAENAGYQNVLRLIQPQMSQNDELFTSQLANQGIMQGSEAYDHAMLQHQQANSAAYSQAALTGVQAGQAFQQEALTNNQQDVANYTQQYNAPINEYQALQNGVQVNNPTFTAPQNNVVNPTNSLSAAQQAYQAQLNGFNAQTSSNNSLATGLFGLGGSFLNSSGQLNKGIFG